MGFRLIFALLAGHLGFCHGAVKIDAMKHDIQQVTSSNFDSVISKFRDSSVSSLWYFHDDNAEDIKFLDEYNKVASELKGMAKVCAISCTEWPVFCQRNKVTTTPAIQIYPPNPVPHFSYEGKMEAKAISGKLSRFFLDNSAKLTSENIDGFLTTEPTKPKILLFSNKKSPPTIFKALSSETVFRRTVKFGFVPDSEADLVKRFKVKSFPTILKHGSAKPGSSATEPYTGEMNFISIRDWVNLHSESGMGDKVLSAGAKEEESIEEAKPWLVQEVPELTLKSHQDICFKGEGLCVIYLKNGVAEHAEVEMLTRLSKKFTSQLSDRGAKMKWMWMNLAVETAFSDLFEPEQLPSAVVFNPHKRLRFAKMDHGEEGEIKGDEVNLERLMDKVLGGDARFKMVPGQKLPGWAQREAPKKGDKKEL